MNIVYHCFGGAHSSVVVACIHLGLLPQDRKPSAEELMAVPLFDRRTARDHGEIQLLGRDSRGSQVAVMGRRNAGPILRRVLADVCRIYGIEPSATRFVDTSGRINNLMRLGGFLSRTLGVVTLGRPMVVAGTLRAYEGLRELALAVRDGREK